MVFFQVERICFYWRFVRWSDFVFDGMTMNYFGILHSSQFETLLIERRYPTQVSGSYRIVKYGRISSNLDFEDRYYA